MGLSTIVIEKLRSLIAVEVSLSPEVNIFTGDNGSGKTSFLEAVFLLARGTSFKGRSLRQLINFQSNKLLVRGHISQDIEQLLPIAIAITEKKTEIKMGEYTSPLKSELSSAFPLQLIHPPSQNLLSSSPKERRQFLDWGVFHVEHLFFHVWRSYARILKQRNAMLRSSQTDLDVWDIELGKYGMLLTEYRSQYIKKLLPYFNESVSKLLNMDDLEIIFQAGWNAKKTLQECLIIDRSKDIRYKATQSGSHRDDFIITIHGRPVQHYLSRGNIKMLVIALQLAQTQCLVDQKGIAACLLLDDVFSELDRKNSHKMLEYLVDMRMQKIITGFDPSCFSTVSKENCAMFHVEHGQISLI